jgi:hypothetical protein
LIDRDCRGAGRNEPTQKQGEQKAAHKGTACNALASRGGRIIWPFPSTPGDWLCSGQDTFIRRGHRGPLSFVGKP